MVKRPTGAAAGRPPGRQDRRTCGHTAPVPADRRAAQLVGDVGLVAVDPEQQGTGVGAALLARTREALCGLGTPFGFLTCGEQVAGFYACGGWTRVPGPTRMIRADGRMQVYGGASMVLALATPIDAWPSGRIDRNGWEV